MTPGGPCAHRAGGRGYPQRLVYCSQHPLPWQGTIPGAPIAVSPGRRVHSTHQHPPRPPMVPPTGGERVKDLLARAIVLDTMERKRMPEPKFLQLPPDRWTEPDK